MVEIASASGLSIDTVRRIDRGDVLTLQVRSLLRVANALEVPASELISGLARTPNRHGLIQLRSGGLFPVSVSRQLTGNSS